MGAFSGGIVTSKGLALLAKVMVSQVPLNFTKIKIGDGDLGGAAPADLTDLKHLVKSINITELKTQGDGNAYVTGYFSNEGLNQGFYWKEIGLYATDPQLGEILFSYDYAVAGAEYIPADGGAVITEKTARIHVFFGSAQNVSAVINSSLVYASAEALEGKVDKVPGKDLSTNDFTQSEKEKLASIVEASQLGKGLIQIASLEEAMAGSEGLKALTPLAANQVINNRLEVLNGVDQEIVALRSELMESNRKIMALGAINALKDMPDFSVYDFLDSSDAAAGTTASYDAVGKKYSFNKQQVLKLKDDPFEEFMHLGVRCYNSSLSRVKVVTGVVNSKNLTVDSGNYVLNVNEKLLMIEASTGLPKECKIVSVQGGTLAVNTPMTQLFQANGNLVHSHSYKEYVIGPGNIHYRIDYTSSSSSTFNVLKSIDSGLNWTNLITVNCTSVYKAMLSIDPGNNVYIVYVDVDSSNFNVMCRVVSSIGTTISSTLIHTYTGGYRHSMEVFTPEEGLVYVFYVNSANYTAVRKSTTSGMSWTNQQNVYFDGLGPLSDGSSPIIVRKTRNGKILLCASANKSGYNYSCLRFVLYNSLSEIGDTGVSSKRSSYWENNVDNSRRLAYTSPVILEHPQFDNVFITIMTTDGANGVLCEMDMRNPSGVFTERTSVSISDAHVLNTFISWEKNEQGYKLALISAGTSSQSMKRALYTFNNLALPTNFTLESQAALAGNHVAMGASSGSIKGPWSDLKELYSTGENYVVEHSPLWSRSFKLNYVIPSASVLELDRNVTVSQNEQVLITSQLIIKQDQTELGFSSFGSSWGQDYIEYEGNVSSSNTVKLSIEGKTTQLEALAYYKKA